MEACGQYDDDEYDCRANFYIATMNVSATDFEQMLNITIFYDKEIECDEFVSHAIPLMANAYLIQESLSAHNLTFCLCNVLCYGITPRKIKTHGSELKE